MLVLMFDFRCFDCGFCCLLWFAYLCCGIVGLSVDSLVGAGWVVGVRIGLRGFML